MKLYRLIPTLAVLALLGAKAPGPSDHAYINTGTDAATAREKGTPPEVGPGKAGGYLAAGIGIAALGGLFASRRRRTRHDERNPRDGRGGPFTG